MANIAFCIYCDSLDVSETKNQTPGKQIFFEYYCYSCREGWSDDESVFEVSL